MAQSDDNLNNGENGGEDSASGSNSQNGRLQNVEGAQLHAILSDPDVRAVLQRKANGQQIKFAESVEETTEDDTSDDLSDDAVNEILKDLPAEDPQRKALGAAMKSVHDRVNAQLKKKLGILDDLNARIQQVEGVAGDVQKKEVLQQVEAARSKYQDFNDYGKAILTNAKKHEGLTTEELYILSKFQAGKLNSKNPSTFSERPTGQPQRGTDRPTIRKQALPPGKRGFATLLEEAFSRNDFSSKE
jgi:hypothetical protein